jgi:hypothetical protein
MPVCQGSVDGRHVVVRLGGVHQKTQDYLDKLCNPAAPGTPLFRIGVRLLAFQQHLRNHLGAEPPLVMSFMLRSNPGRVRTYRGPRSLAMLGRQFMDNALSQKFRQSQTRLLGATLHGSQQRRVNAKSQNLNFLSHDRSPLATSVLALRGIRMASTQARRPTGGDRWRFPAMVYVWLTVKPEIACVQLNLETVVLRIMQLARHDPEPLRRSSGHCGSGLPERSRAWTCGSWRRRERLRNGCGIAADSDHQWSGVADRKPRSGCQRCGKPTP